MRFIKFGQIGILLTGGAITSLFMIGLFVYFTFVASSPTLLPIVVETENFRIHSTDKDNAAKVASLAEDALRRIKSEIFVNSPAITSKIDIFLWDTPAGFRNSVIAADISDTGVSRLFMAEDGTLRRRIDVRSTAAITSVISHEIAHLLMGELDINRWKKGKLSIPLAIHEGIAILAEGRCNDELLMRAGINMACARKKTCANTQNHISHFDKLMQESNYTRLANACDFYAESYSLVEYLMRELKPEGLGKLLHYLENGETLDEAIQLTMGNASNNFKASFIHNWHAHAKRNTDALIAMH